MKKQAEIIDVENEGLISLLGETITLMCMNYTYTGKLTGVNNTCVLLENPAIVFETGDFSDDSWKDVQRLPHKEFYVQLSAVESFGVMK